MALMVAAVIVVTLIVGLVVGPVIAQNFDNQLSRRGAVIVGILGEHQALRLALSLGDTREAGRVAQELLSGDGDLQYVVLLDGDDRVLGSATQIDDAQAVKGEVSRYLRERSASAGEATAGEDGVYRFIRVVKRDAQPADELAALAGDTDTGAEKPLGTILLGLSAADARRALGLQTFFTIAITGGALLFTFLVFFSRIAVRLRRMSVFASRVAGGDLSASIEDTNHDEIGQLGQSLQEMTQRTGAVVGRLQEAAHALATVSSELLASSSQQGEAATQQTASVAETGATVAQLRENFGQASARAQAVIELAQRSEESTTTGKGSVEESVAAMVQIRDQVTAMSATITRLVDRTVQIRGIIDTVNDLAEQSNVLAVNAGIEAAKAGEQGRGFAVIAREVRNLASHSKEATSQVGAMLKDIERATEDALRAIDEGTRRTQAGMDLAHRAGEAIVVLDRAINESSAAARQIAASTRQQAEGVDLIWQAMRNIDRAVNEGASGIRNIESVSRNMTELSEQMTELVSRYRVSA